MRAIDLAVFRWINNWPDVLSPFFRFLSDGNKWLPVQLALLAYIGYLIWRKDTRTAVLVALFGVIVSNELCDFFKSAIADPRPCNDLADAIVRTARLTSFGTVSAHASNMMTVAVTILLFGHRSGWVWLVVAGSVGLSRIYNGVHYPHQVLLGWMLGAGLAGGHYLAVDKFRKWREAKAGSHSEDQTVPDAPESQSADLQQ